MFEDSESDFELILDESSRRGRVYVRKGSRTWDRWFVSRREGREVLVQVEAAVVLCPGVSHRKLQQKTEQLADAIDATSWLPERCRDDDQWKRCQRNILRRVSGLRRLLKVPAQTRVSMRVVDART